MNGAGQGARRWWLLAAGFAAVAAFAVLAGRFWHPYYGFTRFVQLDEADARNGIHEIRQYPVFVYDGFNGYDGAAYTQIAFHPLLDSPELQPALGNVPYRARRILGSAAAWLLAAGNPARIANTYAALNLVVWLGLAFLLWRVLPVTDARSWVAWAGVMFSAGSLHAVRLALTDLLAAALVTAALWQREQGRPAAALSVLATAGLARETALAAVSGLWSGPWRTSRAWLANGVRVALVALPLAAWMGYVRWKAGPAAQGLGNFTWPIAGWVEKWIATLADFRRRPDFLWLNTTTLLALVALTVQATYFLGRWRWSDAWWRVGLSGVAMMALLGTSVWEGHPGAATRVLLPMAVAFAVVAVRRQASWAWILGGSLTVCSGVLALWHVPPGPRELAAGTRPRGGYVARLDSGWYGVERDARSTWAWAGQSGRLWVDVAPRGTAPLTLRLRLRAITPRDVDVLVDGASVWRGPVGERAAWIEFTASPREPGRLALEVRSTGEPVKENASPDARALGVAVYGVEVK